jgi:hypothetical protein
VTVIVRPRQSPYIPADVLLACVMTVKITIVALMLMAGAAMAQPFSGLRSDAVARDQARAEQAHMLHVALRVRMASLRH